MSIADQLKKLEKDPAFQKKVAAARVAARKAGKPFGQSSVGVSDEAEARMRVDQILAQIHSAITTVLPHMPRDMFQIINAGVTASGEYRFVIFFKPEMVHRESLYRAGYPDGLGNIVALYSHGSEPIKNPVWNNERHIFIPSGWHKEPDPFLTNAVSAINAQMNKDGVRVILDAKYYP